MLSTCTTSRSPWCARAFTVVELMVGVAIAGCLSLAIAPLWLSLEKMGDGETDKSVWFIQARVATAGFERDLRLASSADCPFPTGGPILEATHSQIVVLSRYDEVSPPVVVEWEVVKGALMRRWRRCPVTRPAAWVHPAYLDSKTMLEDVRADSGFAFYSGSRRLAAPLTEVELASVTTIRVALVGGAVGVPGVVDVSATGRVGW